MGFKEIAASHARMAAGKPATAYAKNKLPAHRTTIRFPDRTLRDPKARIGPPGVARPSATSIWRPYRHERVIADIIPSTWSSEMSDYALYYWSVPFRGQFVRAVLAYAGKAWTEGGDAAISMLMNGPVNQMPVPFMGPPMLIDKKADFAIAQTPAILLYLGETLDLMPANPALRAMTMKIVNDANDVIDEITLDGGREMWTKKRWEDFVPRLQKWMSFWEETGRRHGLKADSGFLLGGETGIADIVTAILWSTMISRFSKIETILGETAPMTAALTRRIADLPPLAKLAAKARRDYGDAYCGGQIEASLRKVLDA
jgi:glutathione S-transferase